ncbi:hypothetical protein CEW88_06690 [Alloyangia pacifica]|uniref:Uncharacterized protein n=1 Tax=Alloyangia pacifica TaxID=311180 RepID=A0A2U8HC57_9RHOB|nr:hypothetical protein CEW88_06690 [Alloyangia pacifica]
MRRFPAAGARRFATLNHDALHALDSHLAADPVRAGLPAAAVRGRKARFAALMGEEPYRALMGRRLVTPPSRPLKPELARALSRRRDPRPASRQGPGFRATISLTVIFLAASPPPYYP